MAALLLLLCTAMRPFPPWAAAFNHATEWAWESSWNVSRVLYRTHALSLTVAGILAGSLLIAATLRTGPGMAGAYLPWGAALIQATPEPIRSITLSPTGFPLVHQYLGTGLFVAIPRLLSGGTLNLEESSRVAGSVAILLTLACFASLLYEITRKRIGLVLLGISLLLVATNTGYYITLLGAELFALALVTAAIWLAWTPTKIRHLHLAGLSALAALLMTVRPQSTIMVLPALVLGVLRWSQGRRISQLPKALLYGGLPLPLGVLIVFQFHYWMTGDGMSSPYSFGNHQFKSVDLSARYLGLVLFDPKAGLLSCTPFIALGLCASLLHALNRRADVPHRAFHLVCLLAGLAQIWVISGFYGWSGGYWTFGSRHLNLLAIYGVISVVHLLASEEISEDAKLAFFAIALACEVYTATLLGLPCLPAAIIVGGTAAVVVALSTRLCRDTAADLVWGLFGLSFLFPIVYYYAWLAKEHVIKGVPPQEVIWACIVAAAAFIALFSLWKTVLSCSLFGKAVSTVSLLILILEVILVARLRVGATAFQARELISPSPQFLYKNRLHMEDLEVNAQQESYYHWPENERQAMKAFLEQEKRRTVIPRPAPIR